MIPVPTRPIYDISEKELEELTANVSFLEDHDAAVGYPWDSEQFQEWQLERIREALAVGPAERDSLYDSRLLLQEVAPGDVIATPVYGSRVSYDEASQAIENLPAELLTVELAQRLTVPAGNVPLEDLIALRRRDSFRSAMTGLRNWRTKVLPDLVADPSDAAARSAGRDFDSLTRRYEEEMREASFQQRRACVVSVLALGVLLTEPVSGAFTALSVIGSNAFGLRNAFKPFWKAVRDQEFAAAGVISEAQEVFDRYRPEA